MGRVYLPALDEGLLPIRQAKEDEEVAEERRLLYVGITRARRFLALSSSSRRPSRFLEGLGPPRPKAGRPAGRSEGRVRVLPGAPVAAAAVPDDRLLEALRRWRRERASADNVPAYVVAHDTTLAEIVDVHPRSCPRSVASGHGPTKLERYGPEILAVIEGAGKEERPRGLWSSSGTVELPTMARTNLTVQLDREVIRRARAAAAKRGSSVTSLVARSSGARGAGRPLARAPHGDARSQSPASERRWLDLALLLQVASEAPAHR